MKVWYDPRLQRHSHEDESGYGELTNIREGRQPASLFDSTTEGYSKVDATEFDMTPEFGRRSPFSSQ
jgi:hypothetical protein